MRFKITLCLEPYKHPGCQIGTMKSTDLTALLWHLHTRLGINGLKVLILNHRPSCYFQAIFREFDMQIKFHSILISLNKLIWYQNQMSFKKSSALYIFLLPNPKEVSFKTPEVNSLILCYFCTDIFILCYGTCHQYHRIHILFMLLHDVKDDGW